jgi:molecular chaperone GrpE
VEEIVSENNSDNQNAQATSGANSEVDDLKAQVEKFKNDYLYLRAEFDNYRRNVIKERADLIKYGSERLVVDILGVLDNFERAMETRPTPENLATFTKGIEMTQTELRNVLVKYGVSEVPARGLPFDPAIHEALSSEETAEVQPGFVSRVFKKPYKLHDKVIRPGQVVVAKEPISN